MTGTIHIVGLGVSGLSAAVRLSERGQNCILYEGAGHAGGRCRSFHDARLDCLIDNGNHLLLSGNKSALSYLDLLNAREELEILDNATFPFIDLGTHERWSVTLDEGLIPWWVFSKDRSIPGVRLSEFASALKLPFTGDKSTISDVVGTTGKLFERFWEPMTWAVLNTTPDRASAKLMWSVFRETFAMGGAACRPMIAKRGLSETFVDPALSYLRAHDVPVHMNTPVKSISHDGGKVSALEIGAETIALAADDRVLLAIPRAQAARLIPALPSPDGDAAIVNAHFRLKTALPNDKQVPLLGLINAKTHWIFTRGDIISLTISAADALGLDRMSEEELLPQLWAEVITALDLPNDLTYQAGRLIRERRATFDQSPSSVAKRPATRTHLSNLFLAGDWTDTGLPATIEASIRSGEKAAREIIA